MELKPMIMTVLAGMLAVTISFADQQADYIKQIRDAGPTADFSQTAGQNDDNYRQLLFTLGEADGMIYFQDHKDIKAADISNIGLQHAFKHHLIGAAADLYSASFFTSVYALIKKE